jgi:hypothetical protein
VRKSNTESSLQEKALPRGIGRGTAAIKAGDLIRPKLPARNM